MLPARCAASARWGADVLPEPGQLNWLNLLLVPVVGLLMQIRSDIAAMRSTQDEHARRLNAIDARSLSAKR